MDWFYGEFQHYHDRYFDSLSSELLREKAWPTILEKPRPFEGNIYAVRFGMPDVRRTPHRELRELMRSEHTVTCDILTTESVMKYGLEKTVEELFSDYRYEHLNPVVLEPKEPTDAQVNQTETQEVPMNVPNVPEGTAPGEMPMQE